MLKRSKEFGGNERFSTPWKPLNDDSIMSNAVMAFDVISTYLA
jgi:hypothetical protein